MAFRNAVRVAMSRGFRFLANAVEDELATAEGDAFFAFVHLRDGGGAHGGEANQFHGSGHGVGGELATAGSGTGAGVVFDFEQFEISHLAGGIGSDGFEDILNGDVVALVAAGQDGAAIQNDTGDIETEQRHGGAWDGFVACDESHDAVEHVAARDEFDGIGNHFAADEGSFHAFGAHGDAIADGDRVELHGGAARGTDAGLDVNREVAQFVIAVHRLGPGIGDADDGLAQILIGEADGFQKRACGGAVAALRDGIAV